MALLSTADAKNLVAKAREISDAALQPYLDSAEAWIRRQIGNPDGSAIVRTFELSHPQRLMLGRPVRGGLKSNVTSIKVVKATLEDVPATSWYFLDPSTLWRESCWPTGGPIRVTYTAEDMTAEAKQAQAQLVAVALISDGIGSIEDGEYVERRLQGSGNTADMIAKAQRRILASLVRGEDAI